MQTTAMLLSEQIDAAFAYLTALPNFDQLTVDEAVEALLAYLDEHH